MEGYHSDRWLLPNASQLSGAWLSGPEAGAVSSSPETLPQIAAYMADHLWRREAPPERLAIRCQAADPVEDGISGLGVEE